MTAVHVVAIVVQPGEEVLSVWTDYPLVRENLKDDRFAFTDDRDAADIVFSVSPIRNFLSMPRCAALLVRSLL